MNKIINIYGHDANMVVTVACRLKTLVCIPIVESRFDARPYGIMTIPHLLILHDALCYNHCIDTNDVIDDYYVMKLWHDAELFFDTNIQQS
jgi:hypothetical protein